MIETCWLHRTTIQPKCSRATRERHRANIPSSSCCSYKFSATNTYCARFITHVCVCVLIWTQTCLPNLELSETNTGAPASRLRAERPRCSSRQPPTSVFPLYNPLIAPYHDCATSVFRTMWPQASLKVVRTACQSYPPASAFHFLLSQSQKRSAGEMLVCRYDACTNLARTAACSCKALGLRLKQPPIERCVRLYKITQCSR